MQRAHWQKNCDVNIEDNGYYNLAGEKCYCKIVNGKRAEKYPWEIKKDGKKFAEEKT
jgi:hypothetical protein